MASSRRSGVYFSTSAIWILRSNSPAGPLAISPAEWKPEPDAPCPDSRRNDARLRPVDSSRTRRRRHPADVLRNGDLHRLLREGVNQYQRAVLPGRPRDDRMDRRAELRLRQPGFAGVNGMGGCGLPVRHSGDALVLDRRDSRNALPGHRDDALLLHLEDALGT